MIVELRIVVISVMVVGKDRRKAEMKGRGRTINELLIINMSVCFSLGFNDGFLGVHYFSKQMELKD